MLGNQRDPNAIKTLLGWGIIGPVSTLESDDVEIHETSCNRIVIMEIASEKKPNIVFVPESRVKEIIDPLLINMMFELDFHENSNMSPTHSYNDDDGTKFASDKGCKEDYVANDNESIRRTSSNR